MRHASIRIALAVAALVPVSQATSQAPTVGWSFTMNMTVDSGKANGVMSLAVRQQILGQKLRMEFVQASNAGAAAAAEGMYQIFNAADSTVTMVMPNQHMATVMPIGGMLNKDLVGRISTSAPHLTKSVVEDLGAGEKIMGHATHRVRVTKQGTLDLTLMGRVCTRPIDDVSDIWFAADVDLRPALESMSKVIGNMFGMDATDLPTDAATSLPPGTPLRTVTKEKGTSPAGAPITITTTTDLLDLTHGPLAASLFDAPTDYQVMNLGKMMANMPAGMMDSAFAAGTSQAADKMCSAGSKAP